MRKKAILVGVTVLGSISTIFAASFQGLGDLPGGSYESVAYAISGIISASSLYYFFTGFYYGDIPQILFALMFLGISFLGFSLTSKIY